ncbi:MAG TPA: adenylate/guanylate cyclase domain-containing protein, partial [Tepidisphaeraceae bacterium]|nr:adenylate/guanylate cyclase domain-containing protein [Tepidisphaeraceae bacterium]
REKLAKMIDEIDLAGAKVVDLDIIESDPEVTIDESNPSAKPIDHDKPLAEAIARFDKDGRGVLVPFSVKIDERPDDNPIRKAMLTELTSNPELENQPLAERILQRGFNDPNLVSYLNRHYSQVLNDAMFDRIKHEMETGTPPDLEKLRAKILPKSFVSGVRTDAWRALVAMLPKVQSYEALYRFTRVYPPGLPPLLSQDREDQVPIPAFMRAAAFSGIVDFRTFEDATIRTIPLWVLDRNRMVPHMALSLACAQLGVNPNSVKLAPDHISIPRSNGKDIVIPVHTAHTDQGDVGMLMDIPWFGAINNWETMYDWPSYTKVVDHYPLVNVWDVCQIEPEIESANRDALEAVHNALANSSPDTADQIYQNHPDFSDWNGWNNLMTSTLSDTLDTEESLDPGFTKEYEPYLDGTADIDNIQDTKLRELIKALHLLKQNPGFNRGQVRKRDEQRLDLQRKLAGKAVVIGTVATGDIDFHSTPIDDNCPGVVVYGVIFNAIMTDYFIHPAPHWLPTCLTLGIGLLVTFSASYLEIVISSIMTTVIVFGFLFFDFFIAYDWGRTEIEAAGPLVAAVLSFGGCSLWRFFRERGEKNRITRRFSSYVDASLVNYVLDHPEQDTFKGEERELSVVFTDLAGFTTLSEILKTETVPLLNEYLGLMQPVVRKHHGYLNKFLGDGIMFFFGAPEPYPGDPTLHAVAAVETVIEMQQAMLPLNVSLASRGLPELKMRAGVSTGLMVVGDAGTEDRADYTVLGDRVNFASRLESANKATGTLILISDRTVELLRGRYLVRPIGRLQVVGKKEPVMTYEPLAPLNQATEQMHKLVNLTQAVTDSFVNGHFADCLSASHELLMTFGEKTQGPLCALYRRLSLEYLRKPPEDFLGQIKLESK